MGIDVKQLSPAAQAQALRKLAELKANAECGIRNAELGVRGKDPSAPLRSAQDDRGLPQSASLTAPSEREPRADDIRPYDGRRAIRESPLRGNGDAGARAEDIRPGGGSQSKYHNAPAVRIVGGGRTIRFDSRREAARFDELCLLERAGAIRELRLQQDFTLQEAYTLPNGNRVREIRYRADFVYERRLANSECGIRNSELGERGKDPSTPLRFAQNDKLGERSAQDGRWVRVVEDVKSPATRTGVYAIKKKLMLERFGIEIEEVE